MKQNRNNVAAGLASVLSFLALATFAQAQSSGAGCVPGPVWTTTQSEPQHSDNAVDDTSHASGSYYPHDEEADDGWHVIAAAGPDTSGDGSGLKAVANAYVWAEDGNSHSHEFTATAERSHTFRTECAPASGHAAPPNGSAKHSITARGTMKCTIGATAGAASRSAEITLRAELPTGDTVVRNYSITSSSAPSHSTTVAFTANGSMGSDSETKLKEGDDPQGALQSTIGSKKGLSGTFTISHTKEWKDNEQGSVADDVSFTFRKILETSCHGFSELGVESPSLTGEIGVTASNDLLPADNLAYVHAMAQVTTQVTVESLPGATCGVTSGPVTEGGGPRSGAGTGSGSGGTGPVTPGGGPSTGGTGGGIGPITPGGGSSSPDGSEPFSVGGSQTTAQSVACGGRPTRATIYAEAGAAFGAGMAIFDVRVPATAGSANLYFRVAADAVSRIAMGLTATVENSAVGAASASTSFDPSVGTSVGAGTWTIRIPINCAATGQSRVEMSTTATFDAGTVNSVSMEVVNESFSMDGWAPGVHLGTSVVSNVLQGFAPEQRFYIDSLLSSSAALGTPTMSYSVRNGASVNWGIVPTLAFDAVQGRYYVTMVPLGPAIVDVTITANGHSIVCPIEWKDGIPNSL